MTYGMLTLIVYTYILAIIRVLTQALDTKNTLPYVYLLDLISCITIVGSELRHTKI